MAEIHRRTLNEFLPTVMKLAERIGSGETIEPETTYESSSWEIHIEEDHVSYFDYLLEDEFEEIFRAPIDAIRERPKQFIQLMDEANALVWFMDMLRKKPRIYITDQGKFRCIYWSDNEYVFEAEDVTMSELGFERDVREWILDADTYQEILDALTALGVPEKLQKTKFRRLNF